MSSRHSVLITGAPSGIGAVDADCFARGGSDTWTRGTGPQASESSVSTRNPAGRPTASAPRR